ncbi:PKD domain-containing protein [Salinimicrobium terrae]|uniref:PKD domain-containing protein n=1 Tax=Salinimicrobium terrae TaxID=470866 RepID=UPI003CCC3456
MISGVPSGTSNLAYSHWGPINFTAPAPPDLAFSAISSKIRGRYQVDLSWNTPTSSKVRIYRDGNIIFEPGNSISSYVDHLDNVRDATFVYKVCEVLYQNCSEKVIIIGNGGDTSEPGNSSPIADFSFSANLLDVQFTDLSTDSDGSIASWNWNFGDGTSSSLQHPLKSYGQAGTYEVSLNVTDDLGVSQSVTKSISVSGEITAPPDLQLTAVGSKVKGMWQTKLSWNLTDTANQIDIYRDGEFLTTVADAGSFTDKTSFKGSGSLTYKICESGTTICSNSVTAQF